MRKNIDDLLADFTGEDLTNIIKKECDALEIPYVHNGKPTVFIPLSETDFY